MPIEQDLLAVHGPHDQGIQAAISAEVRFELLQLLAAERRECRVKFGIDHNRCHKVPRDIGCAPPYERPQALKITVQSAAPCPSGYPRISPCTFLASSVGRGRASVLNPGHRSDRTPRMSY